MWLEWIDLVHLWQDLGTKLCHRDYRSCCELKTLCQSLHARTQVFEDYYHLKFHGTFKGMFHLQNNKLKFCSWQIPRRTELTCPPPDRSPCA
jgi:hypothetical protein